MRRFFILVLLLASAVTLRAASYEVRSPHYSVAIDVVTLGNDGSRYDVKITDVVTGAVLVSRQLVVRLAGTSDDESRAQDLSVWIHIREGARLTANIEVVRGDDTIDSIQGTWSTRPKNPPATTTADGSPFRVGGDVKAPVLLNRIEPVYTEEARKARIMGIVIVEATIGQDGLVKNVRVLKPLPFGLDQAAVDAVKQWTFKPATINGQAVDVLFNLTVNFKLQMAPPPPPPD
jgi:TonB family protein